MRGKLFVLLMRRVEINGKRGVARRGNASFYEFRCNAPCIAGSRATDHVRLLGDDDARYAAIPERPAIMGICFKASVSAFVSAAIGSGR